MAHRQFTLSEEERAAFRRAEAGCRDAGEWKRLQAVRLYGEGRPVAAIQAVVGCSWRSLMDYKQRYQTAGLAGLAARRQSGEADGPAATGGKPEAAPVPTRPGLARRGAGPPGGVLDGQRPEAGGAEVVRRILPKPDLVSDAAARMPVQPAEAGDAIPFPPQRGRGGGV